MTEEQPTRCIQHAEMLHKIESQVGSIAQSMEERVVPLLQDFKEELWPGGGQASLLSRISSAEGDLERIRKDLGINGGSSLVTQFQLMQAEHKSDHEDLVRFKKLIWKLVAAMITSGGLGGGLLTLLN